MVTMGILLRVCGEKIMEGEIEAINKSINVIEKRRRGCRMSRRCRGSSQKQLGVHKPKH